MYEVLKALHVWAVALWAGGMALAAMASPLVDVAGAAALRRAYVRLVTPAMVAALALGLWLATDAGWFRAGWLQAKLVLVVGLTGLHGAVSGQLRRRAAGAGGTAARRAGVLPAVVAALVLAVAVLAVVKPSFW